MFSLAALLILHAAPSHEEPLEAASALVAQARYEDVVPLLEPFVDDPAVAAPQRAKGAMLLGLARHNLLDEPGARAAFAAAVALDAAVGLPPGASPRTVALFEQVRAAHRPAPVVVVQPSGVGPLPKRAATLVSAGLTVALGAVGAALIGSGLVTRSTAAAQDDALSSERVFQIAQARFQWGTGIAFAAAGALVLTVLLYLWSVGL